MKKIKFEDIPVGKMFYYNVWDGLGKRHRFMKVRDSFGGEANAVWMTMHRGILCRFDNSDVVELEVE